MRRVLFDIIISGILILIAGLLLWPPVTELLYWDIVADVITGTVAVLVVFTLCIAFGVIIRKTTSIHPLYFAVGGLFAYLVGMNRIDVILEPESPVHWILYGVMFLSMIFGHAYPEVHDAGANSRRRVLELAQRN